MDTYEVRFETQAGEMVTEIVEASSYTRLEKTILFNVTGGPVVVPVAEYHIDSLLSIKKVEAVEKQKHDFMGSIPDWFDVSILHPDVVRVDLRMSDDSRHSFQRWP